MSDDAAEERRSRPWPSSTARQRRRGRWAEVRPRTPKLLGGLGVAVALVLLVLVDIALGLAAWRWTTRQRAAARPAPDLASGAAPRALAPDQDEGAVLAALVRQQASRERALNLSVALEAGTMDLQREGAPLRRMKVVAGPEATVSGVSVVRLGRPRGRRHLLRVVDADFVWSVPRWVFAHRGLAPPPADAARVRGGLGPLALILDDGTLIYSLPVEGPLSERAYVMPGTVRAEREDLLAIRDSLTPGLPVYLH